MIKSVELSKNEETQVACTKDFGKVGKKNVQKSIVHAFLLLAAFLMEPIYIYNCKKNQKPAIAKMPKS